MSLPVSGFAASAASLCDHAEQIIFNCSVVESGKLISLCASPKLTGDESYLQYRFGRRQKIELVFPAERHQSQKKFRYAHYFRAQVDRTEIGFTSGEYEYTIFSYYEGEEKPARHDVGLSVESENKKSQRVALKCKKPYQAKFDVIESAVPCDKENALNLDRCK